MDVVILAGGLGTRLTGIWSEAKCMVPIAGRPLLTHLIEKAVREFAPCTVAVCLGHKAPGPIKLLEYLKGKFDTIQIKYSVEPVPLGTLRAVSLAFPAVNAPLLVVNGDTLPQYDWRMLEMPHAIAVKKGVYAGACVLNPAEVGIVNAYAKAAHSTITLDRLLLEIIPHQVQVPGFLDVGTPEGFAASQQLDCAEG